MLCTMKISEKHFARLFNILLLLIAVTMIFRKQCTWVIILFVVCCLIFRRKLNFQRESIIFGLIIAAPFLLEILFFWNNSSLSNGLKSAEKSVSLLLFPLFIIGNYKYIDYKWIINYYSKIMVFLLVLLLLRFMILYPDMIDKYRNGIHLWEMGYVFSNSFGNHAPALNMHLAFVAILNFYLVLQSFHNNRGSGYKIMELLFLIVSIFFILLVNTRMALFNMGAGFGIVIIYEIQHRHNFKKVLKTGGLMLILASIVFFFFVKNDPYMKEKYSKVTFAHMDKIGRLDEIDHPEINVFNSLVTRVSIWKSGWELAVQNLPFGVGASDGKNELVNYFKKTNQVFLAKYEFPMHNQFLDFFLKYGIAGFFVVALYIFTIGYLGFSAKSGITVAFFLLFFTSNLTDDFLIRFDGIAFSGFWFSLFTVNWLQQKKLHHKNEIQ